MTEYRISKVAKEDLINTEHFNSANNKLINILMLFLRSLNSSLKNLIHSNQLNTSKLDTEMCMWCRYHILPNKWVFRSDYATHFGQMVPHPEELQG